MIAPRRRLSAALALLAALVALATIGGVLHAPPAWVTASVRVEFEGGTATADPDYATQATVTGAGFQSIVKGFGGVYVLFGWVSSPDGAWRPSRGGTVGEDYRYVPDSESKDNAGFQRFVAFPGSETEGAAQAVMSRDGSWTVDLVIPSARFDHVDRAGDVIEVDCLEVQCGIITIGAHGVKNANNETFTPVRFAAAGDPAGGAGTTPGGGARVGYDAEGAVAGHALTFTAQGFRPGEQVVASFDNGVVAVGPLSAGASGEVAGVLPLPADLRAGTHLLTVTGASSGLVAESEVIVAASEALLPPASDRPPEALWIYAVLALAIVVALTLVVLSAVSAVRRRRRRVRAAAVSIGEATG